MKTKVVQYHGREPRIVGVDVEPICKVLLAQLDVLKAAIENERVLVQEGTRVTVVDRESIKRSVARAVKKEGAGDAG